MVLIVLVCAVCIGFSRLLYYFFIFFAHLCLVSFFFFFSFRFCSWFCVSWSGFFIRGFSSFFLVVPSCLGSSGLFGPLFTCLGTRDWSFRLCGLFRRLRSALICVILSSCLLWFVVLWYCIPIVFVCTCFFCSCLSLYVPGLPLLLFSVRIVRPSSGVSMQTDDKIQ